VVVVLVPIGTQETIGELSPGSGSTLGVPGVTPTIRRVATHNSSLIAGSHNTVYGNVWRVIQQLSMDAMPSVSESARKLCNNIRSKVCVGILLFNIKTGRTQCFYKCKKKYIMIRQIQSIPN